jgi:hypothetical protein
MSSAYCPRPAMSYGQHTWTFCYKHFEIKTFFRRWVVWSAWHLVKLPLCQLDIYSICYLVDTQIGKLLLIQLVFQQLSALPPCTFISLPFGQLALLSTWHLFNLSFGLHTDRQDNLLFYKLAFHQFCQLAPLSTCHLVKLPFVKLQLAQLAALSSWHIFYLSFGWHTGRQLVVFPTCISTTLRVASLHFCRLAIWSTCCFVNLTFVQFVIWFTHR